VVQSAGRQTQVFQKARKTNVAGRGKTVQRRADGEYIAIGITERAIQRARIILYGFWRSPVELRVSGGVRENKNNKVAL